MVNARKPSEELADDVLGFGGREVATAKDLLLRPADVLQAWMAAGPEGGGVYARPLRLYLGLNAILMLILFLQGGAGFLLNDFPPEMMASLLQRSGKSLDAFIADADGWMTLVMVPLLSLFYALAAAPLLRLWDKEDLGWRRGFRATFGWLCAWTVPMLPLAWWGFGREPVAALISAAIILLGVITFVRMGQGRWFVSRFVGVLRAIALMLAVQLAAALGGMMIVGIGLIGALVTP
ncbi:MAG TPA: hypothetical protein VGB60_11365 [Brevundimonas sp.]|jgi:hypothetical protein|uniref:hypothetical protein n=1 Tax=Brevundimonas sp. TaxID=1871086 RepID=UPI002ED93F77